MRLSIRALIFASGNGSNAEALIQKAQTLVGVEILGVVTNNPQARVIQRASDLKVRCFVETKESEILKIAKDLDSNWILLAGYMKLLSEKFIQNFGESKIINIHPSLLPSYPGMKSIERAYKDQVEYSGVSLHYVDAGMDTGKLIRQEKVHCQGRSLEDFEQEIHLVEHKIYTEFLESLSKGAFE